MTRMIHPRCLLLLVLLPCLPAAAENRDFTDLQGRVLRASLEKVEGGDVIVKRSVDGVLVRIKASSLSDTDIRYLYSRGLTDAALNTDPLNPAGSVPQNKDALRSNLENTLWKWQNSANLVKVGELTILKQGAWEEIRLRSHGRMTAWHKGKIQWEGRWEILDPRTIRIAFRDPVGLVLNFDTDVNSFKALNESTIQGQRLGRTPVPPPVVGRWKWNRQGMMIDIREDGTAGSDGKWRIGNQQYEIHWGEGDRFDWLTLSNGNQRLSGKNHLGDLINAERATPSSQ